MDGGQLIASERLLARFDISGNAESVWRVLLEQPSVDLDELGQRANLEGSALVDAIDELMSVSMVRSGLSPTGVITIDPSLALESRLATAERKMAEQAEAFTAIRMLLPQLANTYSRGRVRDHAPSGFEVVSSISDVRRQIDMAADRTRSEIRALDHKPGNDLARRAQDDVLARGVYDRAILATGSLTNPGLLKEFLSLQERGHEARVHPAVNTRVFLYDHDLAVLPVDPANMDMGALFIRVRTVVDALVMMYDAMWEVATPVFSAPVDGAPVGRHARILELLALGHKDEAISRALNIGVRTIRRDVSDLKVNLAVSSRAEIVAAAIRRGWL